MNEKVNTFIQTVQGALPLYRKGRKFMLTIPERKLLLDAFVSIGGRPYVLSCVSCNFKAMGKVVACYDANLQPSEPLAVHTPIENEIEKHVIMEPKKTPEAMIPPSWELPTNLKTMSQNELYEFALGKIPVEKHWSKQWITNKLKEFKSNGSK